jgi:S1-C subfamily serine protease
VNSVSELQEWVARNRPGNTIDVTFIRGKETISVKAVLRNFEGESAVQKREIQYELEGATFEDITYRNLTKLNIDGGVLIKELKSGKWKKSGIREGFIITHIDKVPIDNLEDLNQTLNFKNGGILVEGLYSKQEIEVYGIDW